MKNIYNNFILLSRDKLLAYYNGVIRYIILYKNDIINAFFISGLSLVIFKLGYSLYFYINPIFYYNITVLSVAWGIQFNFPSIIIQLREHYVNFLKRILGINFWQIEDNIYHEPLGLIQCINKYKLKNRSTFNMVMQYLFFKSIQLELFKMAFPRVFLCINFLLVVSLIFNNGFIILNIISLIFLFSRFNLLLSDWTFENFLLGINLFDMPNEDYYINPSWENAVVVGLWATRNFHVYKYLREQMDGFHMKEIKNIIHT